MASTRTTVTTEVEETASCEPTHTRAEILARHVERLGIDGEADGNAPELPAILDAGDYILELDDWERMVVRTYASGTDTKGRPWPGLVVEGLAYQLRCIDRAAALDGKFVPSPEQRAELIDELIVDGTIGITLLNDLQWAINRLIREGQVRIAGRLADFRNAVNHNVSRVRSFVGSATFAKAEAAVKESSDGLIQERWPDIASEPEEDPRGPRLAVRRKASISARPRPKASVPARPLPEASVPARPRPQAAEVRPSSSRLLTLTIVLLVSGFTWWFVASRGAGSVLLPKLTVRDFSAVPSITEVDARPPSLYVTFSGTRWHEMNDLERWRALDQVGAVAERAGYVGAHMRTSDGKAVGQWSRLKGVKAVEPSHGAN
jgi:hypothetical protein